MDRQDIDTKGTVQCTVMHSIGGVGGQCACGVGGQIQLMHGAKSLFGQFGVGGQIKLLQATKSLFGQFGVGGQIQLWQATKSLRGFMPWTACPAPAAGAAAAKCCCMIWPSRNVPFGRCDPAGPWMSTASRLIQT